MANRDGGPAFPVSNVTADGHPASCEGMNPGMSLRAYLAGQALAGIAAAENTERTFKQDAEFAIAYADALLDLLAELNKEADDGE